MKVANILRRKQSLQASIGRITMPKIFPLYALSGFISLGYQVAWFRFFMDWFGSTALTFGMVIASFIGGLGLGAYYSKPIAAHLDRRWKLTDQLKLYGAVELLVGATALLTLFAGQVSTAVYAGFPYVLEGSIWELALLPRFVHLATAVVCVLMPCVFMGATFPLLCHAYMGSRHDHRFPSALYAWNTIGACSGVLVCQFLLLPLLGHGGTFIGMAAANIALGIFFLTGGQDPAPMQSSADPDNSSAPEYPPTKAVSYGILLTCALLSGFLAGALEGDLFKRIAFLVPINPGATMSFISFWAILAIFLASLTIQRSSRIGLPAIQVGFVVALIVYGLISQPQTVDILVDWVARSIAPSQSPVPLPFEWRTALSFPSSHLQLMVVTGLLVFLPFYFVALLLPYVCNLAQASGKHIGSLYGMNTLAFCAGLILFTLLAPARNIFFATKFFLIVFLVATSLLLLLRESDKLKLWKPGLAIALCVAGWVFVPADFDRAFFRSQSPSARSPISSLLSDANVTTYVASNDERLKILYFGRLNMTGTNQSAQAYMRLMAHFPLLAQNNPSKALLIAFGAGNTASAIAKHKQIETIDIVDLNSNVFATAPEFRYWNDNVIDDPRVRLIHDDGRHFLRVIDRKYDLITSEPPPPMAAGVYRLYSREYYESALLHLTPSGMMSQWLPIYQMPPEAVALAIQTFIEVFPEALMLSGWNNNFILIGGRQAFDLKTVEQRLRGNSAVINDLARASITDSVSLLGRVTHSNKWLRENFTDNKVISDQRNELEQLFVTPVERPGLDYDPFSVIRDFNIPALESGAELQGVLAHLGRLRYRVPGFPFESLARVPPAARKGVELAEVDWMQVSRINDDLIRAGALGQQVQAEALTREALRLAREQPEMLIKIARLAISHGNYSEASALLRELVTIEPFSVEGYYLLGRSLAAMGDSENALRALNDARELKPEWPVLYNEMAWILATHPSSTIRTPRQAIELATKAVDLSGNQSAEFLDTLAAAYAAAGDFPKALATAKKALAIAKGSEASSLITTIKAHIDLYEARKSVISNSLVVDQSMNTEKTSRDDREKTPLSSPA